MNAPQTTTERYGVDAYFHGGPLHLDDFVRSMRRRAATGRTTSPALTLDEFKLEQARIGHEDKAANDAISRWTIELEALTRALDEVLSLLAEPYRLYTEASEGIVLMLVQVVCEKIWILDTGVVGVEASNPAQLTERG